MVIVVDEYGNTAGLATMEDLLEVIIGEIRDEHEPDSDVTEDGERRLHRLRQFRPRIALPTWWRSSIAKRISNPPRSAGWSANGWGTCRKAGESVDRDGIRVEVLASDELRVEQVRISRSQTVAQ